MRNQCALLWCANFAICGSPSFAQTAETKCDPHFSTAFAGALDGTAEAIIEFDDGSGTATYIGGSFQHVLEFPANNVARFDGKAWSAVGKGFDGKVLTFCVHDDGNDRGPSLFAAGFLEGHPSISRWNDNQWHAVGNAPLGAIHSLASFDDHSGSGPALYAGGSFAESGLAKWDGQRWSFIAIAAGGSISSMTIFDDDSESGPELYAAGYLNIDGYAPGNHLAKWNGSRWTMIAQNITGGTINAMAGTNDGPDQNVLYVGGSFSSINGQPIQKLAKWNGQLMQIGAGYNQLSDVQGFDFREENGNTVLYMAGSLLGYAFSNGMAGP